MTPFETVKESLRPELTRLNELIHEQLSSDNPLMNSIIDSYLTSKGKQIRPIVVFLCAGMCGPISDRVLDAAAAVELLHNASLIHDDVVDESRLRRNQPTVNALWDNHIAVLVGDFFVSAALHRAIATDDMRIVRAIGRLGTLLSLGEINQIYNAREHCMTEEAYFRVIDFKTASLFVACARVGCYAVDAPDSLTESLARVAELLGQCFQIRDDVFDYFPADKVGKPTGNDLREGKVTLPLLHALEADPDPAMLDLAGRSELDVAQVETLQEFARRHGGIDYAYDTMARLRDRALDIMAALPAGPSRDAMTALFDYIIARDY